MSSDDAATTVTKALADIDRAAKTAAAAIQAEPDPRRAFRLATDLTEVLRERTSDSAELRVLAATRIFEAEHMSLSSLADQIGVSKARAAQLIQTGKQVNRPTATPPTDERISSDG